MEISLAGTRTGEFLLSEAGGERSRELIRLPAGQGMLAAGTLLKADNTVAANGADAVKVLYGPVDTGANAGELPVKGAAIARDAEVFGEKLVWADGVTDDQKLLAALSLAESGIITRWTQQPIASNAADHLVFVTEPLTGTAGVALGPIVVHVKDVLDVYHDPAPPGLRWARSWYTSRTSLVPWSPAAPSAPLWPRPAAPETWPAAVRRQPWAASSPGMPRR